jgi:hypothetical protein
MGEEWENGFKSVSEPLQNKVFLTDISVLKSVDREIVRVQVSLPPSKKMLRISFGQGILACAV